MLERLMDRVGAILDQATKTELREIAALTVPKGALVQCRYCRAIWHSKPEHSGVCLVELAQDLLRESKITQEIGR